MTKETFTVCLKDIQRYDANHDPVTVNYMAIGSKFILQWIDFYNIARSIRYISIITLVRSGCVILEYVKFSSDPENDRRFATCRCDSYTRMLQIKLRLWANGFNSINAVAYNFVRPVMSDFSTIPHPLGPFNIIQQGAQTCLLSFNRVPKRVNIIQQGSQTR